MAKTTNSRWRKSFRQKIARWYDSEFRDLPWRQTDDPYKIWVSEVMLQQTQVQKVIPYYEKFIAEFPRVFDLAAADLARVLKLWEGMGYYARARNLHRAAQQIVEQHRGKFPRDAKAVRNLPGVGPYTAAAIMSIAFHEPMAVVDGNVSRVLARLFQVELDPKSRAGSSRLQHLADELLDPVDPGRHNQAMIELGAVVCKPTLPECGRCPVSRLCRSARQGTTQLFPVKSPRKERPHHIIAAGIIRRGDRVLIARRHENGLLGGLWEFPGGKVEDGETPEQAVRREIREELAVRVRVDDLFMTLDHQYSHFTITLHAFLCTYLSGQPKALGCAEWRWVPMSELNEFAFPAANKAILMKLLD